MQCITIFIFSLHHTVLLCCSHKTPLLEALKKATWSTCCIIVHMGGYQGSLKLQVENNVILSNVGFPNIFFKLGLFLDFTIHFNSCGFFSCLLPFLSFFSSKHGHICQSCVLLACLTALTHQVKFNVTCCVLVFHSRLFQCQLPIKTLTHPCFYIMLVKHCHHFTAVSKEEMSGPSTAKCQAV